MRVRITHRLEGEIDGVQLDRFRAGEVYDMASPLACVLLVTGQAVPEADERRWLTIPARATVAETSVSEHSRACTFLVARVPFRH